jgi:PAS domain S-box-containing protein
MKEGGDSELSWAREALRRDQLRATFDERRPGLWEWAIPTGRIACSPGFELIHYLVPGTFAGTYEAFLDLVHPGDRESFAAAVSQALKQKSNFCVEYRIALPDNTHRLIESRGLVTCDSQGNAQRVVGVCSDITERRQTLDSLHRVGERYGSIIEVANEGVWLLDTQRRTVYANWRLSLMLGYPADRLVGRRLSEFCFPDDCQAAKDRVEMTLDGTMQEFEFRFRHRDDSEVLVFACMAPARVAQGNIIGVLGLFWDISARKKAEQALRQSEERFRQLTEHLVCSGLLTH